MTLAMGLELPFGGSDPVQLRSVASQLEAGTVWINQHAIRNQFVPASAYNDSGLGWKL
jgi:acyl-CoA reductase-like NAD-dependent aldehyde dehydrogenase